LTGVTGVRAKLSDTIGADVKRAKRFTDQPVCVGFGISTPDHVKSVAKVADGVIVGSAIVKTVEKNGTNVKKTADYVKTLVSALRKT
jgi:tryptophan synthase alpha chain